MSRLVPRLRLAPAALVARALARSWMHRPVRLAMAIAGSVGGVVLTTAILLIAVPVLSSTRSAPVGGIDPGVVAVAARAPAGISAELARRVSDGSGAASAARVVAASTTLETGGGEFVPVAVLGVDSALPRLLGSDAPIPWLRPDEAFLEREWAVDHDLGLGDRFEVTTPSGLVSWRVGALADRPLANDGSSLIVPLATAAAAFHRGSAVDVVLLRPRGDPEPMRERAAAIADGAADVVAPDRIFASYGQVYRTPLALVAIFAVVALLLGSIVLFLTWHLSIAEARPILSRLRLLGVRTRDLLFGSGMVLLPVLSVSYAVGATLGCLVGRSLSSFREQITNFTGQAFDPSLDLALPLLGGLGAAVGMFGFAWLTGLWQLRRATAIDAIADRDAAVVAQAPLRWPLLAGVGCFALAGLASAFASEAVRGAAALPILAGVALLSAVLPRTAGVAIRRASSGSSGLLVGRQLQVQWRQNATLGITFAVALLSSMVMFGVASSIREDIDASGERWTMGQIYVTPAPLGHNYGGETFPSSVRDRIDAMPGVRSTNTFSYVNAVVAGGRRLVETVGGDAAELTAPELTAGTPGVLSGREGLFEAIADGDIAVSSNFARTQDLAVGSSVQLPTADGHRSARVVAVIDDALSDGGMILAGPRLFRSLAGSSRVFFVGIGLSPGADERILRARLETFLGPRYPRAEVLPVAEYRAVIGSMLSRLMSSFAVFAWVMYCVAAVVGTATLAASIAERSRAVALTRLAGGRRGSIRTMFGIEAMVTVAIGWCVAMLGALLAIPATIAGQATFSGLLSPVRIPLEMIAVSLPIAALATAAALFVARRTLSELPLAQLVTDE